MFKPSIKNIVIFFFLKYLLFYVFMMIKNNDYTLIDIKSLRNDGDLFFYLWIFLFLPVVCSILFFAPIYFAFRVKSRVYFMLLISGVFIGEYLLYTYYASQADLINGVYNAILSLLVLLLFFFKSISLIFIPKRTSSE